jgi:hypothetical protein
MKKILLFLSLFFSLHSETVDILANFAIGELPAKFENVRSAYNVRVPSPHDYLNHFSPYDPDLKKIIIFNPQSVSHILHLLPKEKLVVYVWEPEVHNPEFYNAFSKVYTWDDTLIDGVKFFRFENPYLMPQIENIPKFEDKKLCTMVCWHWTQPRIEIVGFFANKPYGEFEFYGGWGVVNIAGNPMFKGSIPGLHSGPEKIHVLSNYRFCICYENSVHLKGYITEKIFACFAAGCIPVYWGATNIEDYIPKECFIDYRNFKSNEELYQFIKSMTSETYEVYMEAIRDFLVSEKGMEFSPQKFDEVLLESIL